MKVTAEFIKELERLVSIYEKEVRKAQDDGYLTKSTAKTYLTHTFNFVKWCNGNFIPGGRNAKQAA